SPRVVLAVGVVLGLLYPIPLQWSGYTYFQTVGFLVLINAMLGVGWNVIGGWAGQFDFAPQVFFAIGAYTAAILFVHLGWSPWLGMLAGVLAAIGICALVTYPLTRLRGHYFAISTVAIWMIAQPIGATWEFINGSRGLFIPMQTGQGVLGSIASLQFVGRTKALGYYYVAFGLLALTLWLVHLVERGRLGFYFRAIRDDQEGAEGIGIPSRLYKVIARSITAAVFAAGGVLYGFWALAVFPEQVLALNWSTLPIMATVVGGIGRLWGPVLGAFILIPISQIMSTTLGTGPLAGRGIDLIVYGIIIVLIAALRPTGILSLPWSRWIRGLVRPRASARSPIRQDDGARDRRLRRAQAPPAGRRGAGARAPAPRVHRARVERGRGRGEPDPGRQEAARDRAGACHRAPPALARRGHVGAHPRRDGGRGGAGAPDPRRARPGALRGRVRCRRAGPPGRLARRAPGRDRGADRRERSREDDAPQGRRGAGGAATRRDQIRRPGRRRSRGSRARPAGSGARARGAAALQPPDGRREPDPWHVHPRGGDPSARDARARLHAFP